MQRAVRPHVASHLDLLESCGHGWRQHGEDRVVEHVAGGLVGGLAVVGVAAAEPVGVVRARVHGRRYADRVGVREDVAEHVLTEALDEAPLAVHGGEHPAVDAAELGMGQVVGALEAVLVGERKELPRRGDELPVADREPADVGLRVLARLAAVCGLRLLDATDVGLLVREDPGRAGRREQHVVDVDEEALPGEGDRARARIGAGIERPLRPHGDPFAALLVRQEIAVGRVRARRVVDGAAAAVPGLAVGPDRHERPRHVEDLRHLDRPDGARHADGDAAVALLERRAHEVMPVRREMEPILTVVGEAELLGVDAVVDERRDDAAAVVPRLHDADHLVGDERVGRPARDQVVGMDLTEANGRRTGVLGRLLDAARCRRDHELDVERVDAGGRVARAADADRVRRRLVVRRAHEHLVEPEAAVAAHLLPDEVPDLLEDALLVGDGDRDLPAAVADDDGPRPDRVEHGGGNAVVAAAAVEIDAVPASVGRPRAAVGGRCGTVDEGLGPAILLVGVVAAVAVEILVGLFEREEVRSVERARQVAVGGVGRGRCRERRCDVHRRRADKKLPGGICRRAGDEQRATEEGHLRGKKGGAHRSRVGRRGARCQRRMDGESVTATGYPTNNLFVTEPAADR